MDSLGLDDRLVSAQAVKTLELTNLVSNKAQNGALSFIKGSSTP